MARIIKKMDRATKQISDGSFKEYMEAHPFNGADKAKEMLRASSSRLPITTEKAYWWMENEKDLYETVKVVRCKNCARLERCYFRSQITQTGNLDEQFCSGGIPKQ